ncbi:hypothetical protein [Reticulibacter mediterranei]|uniref:hypothetical protein n=1 Tax=Reticulibacter mediterranei TaxID=2778369 RepID=UPI001C69175F|nr:hypothetical protein [Reticulibacter mediterranei]
MKNGSQSSQHGSPLLSHGRQIAANDTKGGGMLASFFAGQVFAGFSDQLVISLFVSNALFFLVLRIPHTLHEYILSPTVAAGETTAHAVSAIGGRFANTL